MVCSMNSRPKDKDDYKEKIANILGVGMLLDKDAMDGKGQLWEDDGYLFIKRDYALKFAKLILSLLASSEVPRLSEDEAWEIYTKSGGRRIPPRNQVVAVANAQYDKLIPIIEALHILNKELQEANDRQADSLEMSCDSYEGLRTELEDAQMMIATLSKQLDSQTSRIKELEK